MQQTNAKSLRYADAQILKLALAVCALTVSAKITVPFYPVPMTMQVAVVLLLAGLGGMRFGVTSLLSYMAAGVAGLPVFAGTPEKGLGLAYMAGPTGGYLLGFVLAALCVGWAVDRFGRRAIWAAMPVGLAVIYGCGCLWLAKFVPADKLLALGVMPFLLGDAVKVAVAALLTVWAPGAVKTWIRG